MTISAGDTVRLKSGGPVMTVTGGDSTSVSCGYFRDEQYVPIYSLSAAALDVVAKVSPPLSPAPEPSVSSETSVVEAPPALPRDQVEGDV